MGFFFALNIYGLPKFLFPIRSQLFSPLASLPQGGLNGLSLDEANQLQQTRHW